MYIFQTIGGYWPVQDSPYTTPLGVAFLQAGEEMGYDIVDINGAQQTGFAFYQFNMRRGSRCSMSKAFLRPVRLRRNLHISLFSHTTRVLIDESTKRAIGVEFIKDGKKQVVYAKREVILSAGAIGSPHILLNSGIGPCGHLQQVGVRCVHNLPGVGENLQDHIAVGGIIWRIDEPVSIVVSRIVNVNAAIRYAVDESGPLTSSSGLEVVAFLNTKYANQTDDWPDMNFLMTSVAWFSDEQSKRAHGLRDDVYEDVYKELYGKDTFSIVPMMLRPKSRGVIRLNSTNPLVYPLLYHNYLTDPHDVQVMREGIKMAVSVGETQALKRFGARLFDKKVPKCKHLPKYTDEYWECAMRQYTMTIYHMSGTAKMGPAQDRMAVVNHRLEVHGIKGLRVIDASIMPAITNGNINAPVVMIAEKGADMIKGLWLREAVFQYSKRKR